MKASSQHRSIVPFALAGLLAGLAACGGGPRRPNLVLISIDTLRADYLGCYGHERDVSPAIDAFAAGGTIFEDVTAASPWTLPSHASMLTGKYPTTHGVDTNERGLTEETLGTWLKRAGYETLAVVNTHNVGWPEYGLLRGIDEQHWVQEMAYTGAPIENSAPEILTRARRYLDDRDTSRPFFLFLHFYDVHTDFTPAEKWKQEFVGPYSGTLTGVTMNIHGYRTRALKGSGTIVPDDVRYLEELYDAEIRTFDERLAVFFDYLEDTGLGANTIVAITSDHGEEYGEHGGLLHGRTQYQELVRIPWILRGPGVPVGQRIDVPVHHVDLAPTLLALIHVAPIPGMEGDNAALLWNAPDEFPTSRYLFAEADHNDIVLGNTIHNHRKAVRLDDWVLHYDLFTKEKELYDLSADPWEQRDLSAEEPEMVDHLYGKLDAYIRREGSARDIGALSEENQAHLDALGYGGEDEESAEEDE